VNEEAQSRTPFRTKLLAILVLGICGWILLKLVIGLIAGLATIIVVVACIIGVVWALSKF
jgi:hypothetical protein